ncbi:putative sporulation protein YtxC [Neobacillus piezotolerans]|uniref:putative sporulation protein YtxC n=1 Tax=Neobacillus piezotolerans TaxID=2259171 RepID=UPI0015F19DF4|nr:putative sporulation protein YtxC [Neobacillus piezotolerans]
MGEIIFENGPDARGFFTRVQKQFQNAGHGIELQIIEDRHCNKILFGSLDGNSIDKLAQAFWLYLAEAKWDEWFRGILRDTYYFSDPSEQQHIIDIMHSILEGDRRELFVFLGKNGPESYVKESIGQMLREGTSFSFDSFVKFRLRPFFDYMEEVAALSIDEYKMEQEYLIFIESLREFVQGRPARMNLLHVLAGEEITFYDEQLAEVKRAELVKMIDRKLLNNHPVYVDSYSIAPLLSIAPAAIHLYAEEPEIPLIRTILNIFEERVELHKTDEFPARA